MQSIGFDAFYNTKIVKAFWLGNTPPIGSWNVEANISYVSNNQYELNNQRIYPYLSSKFEVDGVVYVPVSPSDRTCDVVDCNYSSECSEIVISDKVINRGVELKVVNVNDYSFYGNNKILSARISNNGSIGQSAFQNCTALQTSDVSNNGAIGKSAFQNCSLLQTANVYNSGAIGQSAFKNCYTLNDLKLGKEVNELGKNSFSACYSLNDIDIPDCVKSIGSYAFQNCLSLQIVNIGKGVPSLPLYAFSGCSSLESLSIPNNVSSIEDYAFAGCVKLSDIKIEDGDNSLTIGSNGSNPLFADCPLEDVYIGRKLSFGTSSGAGYSPFYRNTSLRSVEITDEETEIYDNEFYGCSNLKTLKIGNGVRKIGKWAFSGCSSLDYFSAGYNVESIGDEAFSDCTGLTKYYSFSAVPPVCGAQALDDINKWECTLYVPAEKQAEYMVAPQWKDFFFVSEMESVPVLSIMLEMTELGLFVGDTYEMTADVVPANATDETIVWSSSDETVATVSDNGVITAIGVGEALIMAASADGNASATCLVTVKAISGIADVESDAVQAKVFDMQGRVVTGKPAPGIYIVNGRKVFVW